MATSGTCHGVTRQLLLYVAPSGNTGKTYMSNYLVLNEGGILLENEKFYGNKYDGQRIAVFDLVRSQQGPYGVTMESVKNGVFTSKTEVPHVVVFSSWPPDLTKMSMDRWSVLYIDTESCRPSRETDGMGVVLLVA